MKFLASLFVLSSSAYAGVKSHYDLFHPVPDLEIREFESDRPDKTESPMTVDAGHFQFEIDLISVVIDKKDKVTTRATTAGATNLRLGLTQNADVHLIVQPYTDLRVGSYSLNSGRGDTTLRIKWNLKGNDFGDTAFALLPYMTFPTADDGLGAEAVEGGVILPFSVSMSDSFDIGAMIGWDKASVTEDSYVDGGTASISMGYKSSEDLSVYVELWAHQVFMKHEGSDLTFDMGLAYQVERYQLDVGVNIGLTDQADDLNPFFGLSGRI